MVAQREQSRIEALQNRLFNGRKGDIRRLVNKVRLLPRATRVGCAFSLHAGLTALM